MKTGGRQKKSICWKTIQDEIAEEKGAAIVLVDETSSEIAISNNNSLCRFLYSSEKFAPSCAEFCGKAFQTAFEAGKPVRVKCHADLIFLTVPLQVENKKLAAIVGRTFLKTEDYRKATERAATGDWQEFPPAEFFSNALISRSFGDWEKAAKRLKNLSDDEKNALLKLVENAAASQKVSVENATENFDETENNKNFDERDESFRQIKSSAEIIEKNAAEIEEFAAWRKVFESLLDSSYARACRSVLEFLAERYALSNLAWLDWRENAWKKTFAVGELEKREIKIEMSADDERLTAALRTETALELRERTSGNSEKSQTLQMFSVAVGGKIRGALIVGDKIENENTGKHITRFLRSVAPELEILRLRGELERQTRVAKAARKFNESLQNIDAENFWNSVAQASAELLRAERGSLLAFDEREQKFFVKAATGSRADIIKAETETLGERVAQNILKNGGAIAVKDIEATKFAPAPPDWKYKTKSFISYPIKIGARKIGIFNAADKADGSFYDASDVELLDAVAPQIAVALDRTRLEKRAGEFEQLSITDALTGLLNRRYLEERLTEEISRSHRYGYPVSFMMIDVDEFKSYNDRFTHPEGDKALKIVGHLMKETLRGADVAARYGGEEFSILLPQTNLTEARAIAERIREKIEQENFPNRRVTVSIGIASASRRLAMPQDLISAADKALYKAKQAGRNNVQIYEDSDL
ncbi:MAG: diguanylate cyclase [Pyrinomonadaceae bacterium]